MKKKPKYHFDRALSCVAMIIAISVNIPAPAGEGGGPQHDVTVGSLIVTPSGSGLSVFTAVGDTSNPQLQHYEVDDSGTGAPAELNFSQSKSLDDSTTICHAQTAHADGDMEFHVTQQGVGGLAFTFSSHISAKTTAPEGTCASFPNASTQTGTGVTIAFENNSVCEWSYACVGSVQDDSDQKDQAHIRVVVTSGVIDLAQAGIPEWINIGGFPWPDGTPGSSQTQMNIVANGTTSSNTGYGGSITIYPDLYVTGAHAGKNVSAQLSITLTVHRISGACCNTPVVGCQQTTASDCAAIPGASYQGVDTDCSSCPGTSSEIHWANAVNGVYADAAKWNPQTVPESNAAASPPKHDVAVYDKPGGYTVTFPVPASSDKALIRNGLPTFLDAAYQLKSLDTTNPSLEIGAGGTLTLQNCPGLAIVHGRVGDLLPGTSTLNLFDSNMSATGFLEIGELAPGKVNVIGNSLLNTQDSRVGAKNQGNVIVDGDDAEWKAGNLAVGFGAAGNLTVQGGGKVAADNGFIGFHNGLLNGDGTVTLTGKGADGDPSRLDVTNDLSVGISATGDILVKDGALVSAKNIKLGENSNKAGSVTVSGAGAGGSPASQFDASSLLVVGQGGIGKLIIKDGGHSSCGTVVIAQNASSIGTATITGADCGWGTGPGNFLIGDNGNATLNILSGAKVGSASAIIGKSGGNSGALVKDGPSGGDPAWRLAGNLVVGGNGGGALEVDNALVLALGSLSVGILPGTGGAVLLQSTGKLKADGNSLIGSFGQLNGTGLYACPFTQVAPGGSISPGVGVAGSVQILKSKTPGAKSANTAAANLIGTLSIDGDLELQDGSILHIDVAGPNDGQHDILKITGTATLNGILDLNFINGYVPQPGDIISFLRVDGATIGQFAQETVTGLPEGVVISGRFDNGAYVVDASDAELPSPNLCGSGACGAGASLSLTLSILGLVHIQFRRAGARKQPRHGDPRLRK